jgi:hypothetical protein
MLAPYKLAGIEVNANAFLENNSYARYGSSSNLSVFLDGITQDILQFSHPSCRE